MMKKTLLIFYTALCFISLLVACAKNPDSVDNCHSNETCYYGGTCINGTCNCPTGFSGPQCEDAETPRGIQIERVEFHGYPALNSPEADGPDIYLTIGSRIYNPSTHNTLRYINPEVKMNESSPNLDFVLDEPFVILDPNQPYSSKILFFILSDQDDAPDEDDLIYSYVYRTPDDISGGNLSVRVQGGGYEFTVHYQWIF